MSARDNVSLQKRACSLALAVPDFPNCLDPLLIPETLTAICLKRRVGFPLTFARVFQSAWSGIHR